MTPDERVKEIMDTEFIHGTIWRDRVRTKIHSAICNAISEAVNADRATRPHEFIGRNDRDCELCGNPDRDEIHFFSQERLSRAIKHEREACKQIAVEIKNREREHYAKYKEWTDSAFSIAEEIEWSIKDRGIEMVKEKITEDTSVHDLGLSIRTLSAVLNLGARNVGGILNLSPEKLLLQRNFGESSLRELENLLEPLGWPSGGRRTKRKEEPPYRAITPALRKIGNNQYELIWIEREDVLRVSVMTEAQIRELMQKLHEMLTLPIPSRDNPAALYEFKFPETERRCTG